MQLEYTEEQAKGIEGDWADASPDRGIRTGSVSENIDFGRVIADADKGGFAKKLPCANIFKLSDDLTSSKIVTGKIIVDGVETSFTGVWDTNHLTTITAIATTLSGISGVDTAVVDSSDVANRTIKITEESGKVVYVKDVAVTGSGGAITVSYSTKDKFSGLSLFNHLEPDSDGNAFYRKNEDAIDCVRKGAINMSVTDVDTSNDVYVSLVDTNDIKRGQVTKSAGTPATAVIWDGAKFLESVIGSGLVAVTPPYLA